SVGSWILSASGLATSVATANAVNGALPRAAAAARPAAALLGLPLSTYTAALLTNTAIPVWHEARGVLAFVFAGGSAASAGAVAGGAILAAGTLAERWAIFRAGFQSAADPKYVVGPQRRRIEEGTARGGSRREPRVASA